ncbi:hypothetical protein Tco_0454557 [Tanacetum coccineum]
MGLDQPHGELFLRDQKKSGWTHAHVHGAPERIHENWENLHAMTCLKEELKSSVCPEKQEQETSKTSVQFLACKQKTWDEEGQIRLALGLSEEELSSVLAELLKEGKSNAASGVVVVRYGKMQENPYTHLVEKGQRLNWTNHNPMSTMDTPRPSDRMCLYIDDEEHGVKGISVEPDTIKRHC